MSTPASAAPRCSSAGATRPSPSVSYMPFVEAIRTYVPAQTGRRPPGGAGRGRLRRGQARLRDPQPSSRVARVVPPERRRGALPALRERVLVPRQRLPVHPIVLLLDDLHWADAPSLRLLQHLSRRLADSRLLVIGTYRDVELTRRHPLAEALVELRRDQSFQQIVLRGPVAVGGAGLPRGDHRTAARRLRAAAGRGASTARREGNPFFLEEVVRHLLETGGAPWEGGRWKIDVGSVEALAIPEGIRELIEPPPLPASPRRGRRADPGGGARPPVRLRRARST